jgi:hypothetical protein
LPENIPHLTSPSMSAANQGGSGNVNMHLTGAVGAQSGSPVKESSFLNRETSAAELESDRPAKENISPPSSKDGIPIRR